MYPSSCLTRRSAAFAAVVRDCNPALLFSFSMRSSFFSPLTVSVPFAARFEKELTALAAAYCLVAICQAASRDRTARGLGFSWWP